MTISNHALVASLIAVSIRDPAIVLPLAFVSHFVLDALPHYGYEGHGGYKSAFKHPKTLFFEALNIIGVLILVFTIHYTWIILLAILLALLPDFEWPYRYWFFEKKDLKPPNTLSSKFHQKIQWCERPWGAYAEVGFFIVIFEIFSKYN